MGLASVVGGGGDPVSAPSKVDALISLICVPTHREDGQKTLSKKYRSRYL